MSKRAKKRTIIVGLKSDNCSREILLKLLASVAKPEDNVLAIHVQNADHVFDPNTFHIHEDLCKSKKVSVFFLTISVSGKDFRKTKNKLIRVCYLCKVDFQVKVCIGDSYISVLTHQVRLSFASILALGSSLSGYETTK